jgi:hypothetical protein
MTKRQWLNRKVVGVGEAMVEFAPVGQNIYRRGFAGDTLNTCWHIAQIGLPSSEAKFRRLKRGALPLGDFACELVAASRAAPTMSSPSTAGRPPP